LRGNELFKSGDFEKAYRAWGEAALWYRQDASQQRTAHAFFSNAGMSLVRLNLNARAISCFQSALAGIREEDDPEGYATILNNIGAAFLHIGHWDEAERYHRDAYEVHLCHGAQGELLDRERMNLAYTYARRARISYKSADVDLSESYARNAAALFDGGFRYRP
jgi:tetratricopeptide (TPR) repeat protein